jgi:hypothetical protein
VGGSSAAAVSLRVLYGLLRMVGLQVRASMLPSDGLSVAVWVVMASHGKLGHPRLLDRSAWAGLVLRLFLGLHFCSP